MSANRSASARDAVNKTAVGALLGSPFDTTAPTGPVVLGEDDRNPKAATSPENTPTISGVPSAPKENLEADFGTPDTVVVNVENGSAPPPIASVDEGKAAREDVQDEDEIGSRLGSYKRPKYRDTHTSRSYYIQNELLSEFDDFCEKYQLDKSMMVNDAIRQHMKNLTQSKKRK